MGAGATGIERASRPDGYARTASSASSQASERLVQLRIGDHERAEDADAVRVDAGLQQQQAAPCGLLGHPRGELGRGLLRRGILDELDREHRAEPADVADLRMALLPRRHPAADGLADAAGALDEALVLEDVEHGERRRLRDGIADVRAADGVVAGASMISALPSTPESGRPAAIDFATVIRSGSTPKCSIANMPPGAAEAGLHLVGDEDDPLAVADLAHALRRTRAARTMKPPSPCTGSRTIAATVSARDLRRERTLERRERVGGA